MMRPKLVGNCQAELENRAGGHRIKYLHAGAWSFVLSDVKSLPIVRPFDVSPVPV